MWIVSTTGAASPSTPFKRIGPPLDVNPTLEPSLANAGGRSKRAARPTRATSRPVATFQMRSVPSRSPDTICPGTDENAT